MRLKEDTSSWRSRSIMRRNYRQAPLTPDEETPRRKSTKRKPKHVHDWVRRVVGKTTRTHTYRNYKGDWVRYEYETDKAQYVCTSCGNKRGHMGGW